MIDAIPEAYQDCEYLLISALLYAPKHWVKAAETVKPEYFYDEVNRKIWNAMVDLKTFDTRSIINKLEGEVDFKTIMRLEGLSISRIITEFEVNKLCWFVVEAYKRTEIQNIKLSMTGDNLGEFVEKIEKINRIGVNDNVPQDVSGEFSFKVDRICRGEKDLRNIPTGFSLIDRKIDGFRKGELVILGGRPGSGKTTLAMNIAFNIARKRMNVIFFSLEMGKIELHERLVSSITELKPYPGMSSEEAAKLFNASRRITGELPLSVDDRSAVTIEDIYLEAKKLKEAAKLDMIVIDHMSILKSRKPFKSRYEEISDISRQLKVLAKDMDVPVLCLCQLNRQTEGREVKTPNMSDLRDSGSIEQDADLIMFVFRPEYHLSQNKPDNENSPEFLRWEDEMRQLKGKANVIIAKNRRGETGSIPLMFNGKYSKFWEAV